jgi:hypothetical protein
VFFGKYKKSIDAKHAKKGMQRHARKNAANDDELLDI